jgi:pyrimidine-specific ribonucleoside hydrolase
MVTGAGETHCQAGMRNALNLVLLAGQETQNIPVACGDEEPGDGYHVFPQPWRDMVDALLGLTIPENPAKPAEQHAVELIIELLDQADEPVNIVTLGPLTNIADALEKNPAIQEKIKRFYIMGGAVQVKGNLIIPGFTDYLTNDVAEWNVYIDPPAARKVIRSDVPVTLVPLDGTNNAPANQEFATLFKERAQTPTAKFVDNIFDNIGGMIESGTYYFWDPLTAAVAADEDICEYEVFNLDVAVKYADEAPAGDFPPYSKTLKDGSPRRHFDPYVSGQTVISEDGKATDVCVMPDVETFKEDFIRILNQ